jgi:colanic acid/amylovoran biosynthesis glycosyltransferase
MEKDKPTVLVWSGFMLRPSETFIRNQARAMRRYSPQFVGVRFCSPKSLLTRDDCLLVSDGGPTGALNELLFKTVGVPPAFLRRVARLQPALIHAHHGVNGALALPLARALGIPLVVTFHGADATQIKPPDHFSLAHRAWMRRQEQLKEEVAFFTADSAFIKQKLVERGYPADRIHVHYVGVDTSDFRPDPAIPREPFVLFVGRLDEKKGCEYLIRAMRRVQAVLPQVRLVLVGDGPLREELRALAAESPMQCDLVGWQSSEQVRQWLNRASVFAAPSVTAASGDSEGLPTVILEAQAMGVPVVATEHAGAVEAIVHEETGMLGAERDVCKLTENITRVCSDDRLWSTLSGNARRQVETSFDIRGRTRILEDHYEELPARSPASPRLRERSLVGVGS